MDPHNDCTNPEPSGLAALYDRLERLLRRLRPDRVEQLIDELENASDGQESEEAQADRN